MRKHPLPFIELTARVRGMRQTRIRFTPARETTPAMHAVKALAWSEGAGLPGEDAGLPGVPCAGAPHGGSLVQTVLIIVVTKL